MVKRPDVFENGFIPLHLTLQNGHCQ